MIPQSLAHRLISTHSPVRDVWHLLHPDSSVGAAEDDIEKLRRRPIPTATFNLEENGATCDSVLNTWRWNKGQQKLLGPNRPTIEIPGDTIDPRAKRLDYIFANTGTNISDPDLGGWFVMEAKVGMLERHPKLQCSLSDHFSVEATFVHCTPDESNAAKGNGEAKENEEEAVNHGVFLKSPTPSILRFAALQSQLRRDTPDFLPIQTYDEILTMIHMYRKRERRQRRLRLGHFVAWIFVSIGCFVAIWWRSSQFRSLHTYSIKYSGAVCWGHRWTYRWTICRKRDSGSEGVRVGNQ